MVRGTANLVRRPHYRVPPPGAFDDLILETVCQQTKKRFWRHTSVDRHMNGQAYLLNRTLLLDAAVVFPVTYMDRGHV